MHRGGRTLDVGHHHRDEAGGQRDRRIAERRLLAHRAQLPADEADRHDLELLGRIQQPQPGLLARLVVVELDLGKIEETRQNWPFLRDRRIDFYSPLSSRLIDPPSGK
jgi:hypothetical protein